MRCRDYNQLRVLAIEPVPKGVGYVVLEGPERLVDWGILHTRRADNSAALERLEALVDRFTPAELAYEDAAAPGSRRSRRVRRLLLQVRLQALRKGIKPRAIAWTAVKSEFATTRAQTKHHIAMVLAARFPELAPRLPPPRKPWMSEDSRMGIFKACALAATLVGRRRRRRRPDAA